MDFFLLFLIIGTSAAWEDFNNGCTKRAPLVFLFSVLLVDAFTQNPDIFNQKLWGTLYTYLYFLVAQMIFVLLKKDKKEFIGQADILFCASITVLGGFLFFLKTVIIAIIFMLPYITREKFRSGKRCIPFIPALLFSILLNVTIKTGHSFDCLL